MDDLVERLREISQEKQQEAWGRADGGQDLSIGAMLADEAADEITALRARLEASERLDCEAATHVESVIAMRTGFTGEPPYVGWRGLGLALNEALDAKDAAEARAERAEAALATARRDAIRDAVNTLHDEWMSGTPLAEIPAKISALAYEAET